ncbi:unnamed protein product [Ectocarpus sp. 6 AP-2014]
MLPGLAYTGIYANRSHTVHTNRVASRLRDPRPHVFSSACPLCSCLAVYVVACFVLTVEGREGERDRERLGRVPGSSDSFIH